MSDPYSAPVAQVERVNENAEAFLAFPRFSTWWVFLLAVVTMGIYIAFWMVKRTKIINTLPKVDPISDVFTNIMLVLFFVPYVFMALGILIELELMAIPPFDMVLYANMADLASGIGLVIWCFVLRNRLNDLIDGNTLFGNTLGPILTFFLQWIYLSYKINQQIDLVKESKEADAVVAA